MRTKRAIGNIIWALILQIIIAISGLVLPRLMISTYGSSVNGLIASITQFLSYISLLEGGVGGVIVASLYKPIADKDHKKIASIVFFATKFYRKLALLFIAYLVIIATGYPLLVSTEFDWLYVSSLVVILSFGTFLQYFFSLSYVNLLSADQKLFVTHIISALTIILNLILTYCFIKFGCDVHFVKIGSCLVFALRPIIYNIFIRIKYPFIIKYKNIENTPIKQRWNGLAHHLAFFVHSNTDIVIITLFLDVKSVSVYAVYFAIISGIEKLITAISSGIAGGIGDLIAKDEKEALNKVFDTFEFLQVGITTVLFTVTSIMILPFISIYISGVSDANYIQPLFGYIMIAAEAIYSIRLVYSTVTLNGGKYKETQCGAVLEAFANIIISLLLVKRLGLLGVAIGTLSAEIIRMLSDVRFLSKNILCRNVRKTLKTISINMVICVLSVVICRFVIDFNIYSWAQWILTSFFVGMISTFFAVLVYFFTFRDFLILIWHKIKGVIKRV